MTSVAKKLVCIGDGSAGKTCLLYVFANDVFPDKYIPTVFENYVASVERSGTTVELALWDTAGQEDYSHIRPLSYQDAHVFLICFSVENRDSFDNVSAKWVPEMHQYCAKVPYLIVGCKTDLRNDPTAKQTAESRGVTMVSKSEGESLANKVNAVCYVECSAKTKDNINTVFERAADVALTTKGGGGGCCVLL